MQQLSRWHGVLHAAAYVLWGTSGFLLLALIVFWVLNVFNMPIPLGVPTEAFEPLTALLGSVGAFAGGLLARWGSSQTAPSRSNPLPSRATPPRHYRKEYLKHTYYQHRYFDVKGLSTQGPYMLELKRVFVELSVAPRAFHKASANPIETVPPDLRAGQHSIWQFLAASQMRGLPLAIIGAPGSGKTTLMKSIALTLSVQHRQHKRKKLPDRLPVLLFLRYLAPAVAHAQNQHRYAAYEAGMDTLKARVGRQHSRFDELLSYEQRLCENLDRTRRYGNNDEHQSERNEIMALLNEFATETTGISFNDLSIQYMPATDHRSPRLDNLSLAQAICEQLQREQGPQSPSGWFEEQLKQGRCLVMFDGLDEVAAPDLRGEVVAWVERQMKAHANNLFLMTSRPYGYRGNPLGGVTVLEVQPFTRRQIATFVHNWYLSNEIMSTQQDDEGVRRQARQQADDLLRRLDRTPNLSALAVNPLLLTMITTVHRYRSSLPGRRVELYAEICEVFLGKRQQARGIELDLTPAQKQSVLQPLAYHMICQEVREIDATTAIEVVREPLKLVGRQATAAAEFLKSIENQSGLLLERENGVYGFAHLTFQEYLAAAHIHEQNLGDTLVERIDSAWWNETIRLYVAQADASAVVAACLECPNPTITVLALIVECSEEAKHLRADLRSRVEQLLTDDLEHPDPTRRRLATGLQLARHLRNLHRLNEQREIDTGYITCAEYQLFLDDMRKQGQYRQPDHWAGHQFSPGNALVPVMGVRAEDAQAFCEWLTQQHGDGSAFRLPTRDEAEAMSVSTDTSAPLATWCQDGDTFSLVGLSLQQEQKIWAQLEEIRTRQELEVPLPQDLDQSLEFALARIHDLNITFSRIRSRARARTHALNRSLDRALNRAHAQDLNLDRDLDRDLDLAFDLALNLALNLDLDLDRALALALAFDLALDLALTDVSIAMNASKFQRARALLNQISTLKDPVAQRQVRLLEIVLDVLIAGNGHVSAVRGLWRRYAARLLEYAWVGYGILDGNKTSSDEEKQVMLNACWWLHIVMAREAGTLPAWEGIRVVRERDSI